MNPRDTTGTMTAIVDALAGIVNGIEGIPAECLDALRGKDVIWSCLF